MTAYRNRLNAGQYAANKPKAETTAHPAGTPVSTIIDEAAKAEFPKRKARGKRYRPRKK